MSLQAGHRLGVVSAFCIAVIHLYRWVLSPFLGGHCRFLPSCSAYGLQAIRTHGAVRGGYMTLRRLLRCHPWHRGGHDPVPRAVAQSVNNTNIEAAP